MRAILTYHSVDDSGSVISVDRATFRRHMEWLSRSGIAVVRLDELLRVERSGDAVALTFDDGFANFATDAWPVLRDLDFPATIFVPTDRVGGTNAWEDSQSEIPPMPLLDWAGLGRLAEAGVEVGSHTRTHPDLRKLHPERCRDEVVGSADRIAAELGRRPTTFAYPYGKFNDAVRGTVADGYRVAVTTELRYIGPDEDPYRMPRLDSYYLQPPGRMESLGTTAMERYLTVRRGLRAARSLVTKG